MDMMSRVSRAAAPPPFLWRPHAQVTKHDDVFMLDGEGMPTVGNPFVKGRLFVIFKVKFMHFTRYALRSIASSRPARLVVWTFLLLPVCLVLSCLVLSCPVLSCRYPSMGFACVRGHRVTGVLRAGREGKREAHRTFERCARNIFVVSIIILALASVFFRTDFLVNVFFQLLPVLVPW